ncbi:hypothetical protein SUGI_0596360 [Cryptomeria japonica]|nr:hypothetical protein SUGI_0596360 [Cryptomeria japonica]
MTRRAFLKPLLVMVLEVPSWLYLAELVVVFTLKQQMLVQILLERLRGTFLKMILETLWLLLTMLVTMLEILLAWGQICLVPMSNPHV